MVTQRDPLQRRRLLPEGEPRRVERPPHAVLELQRTAGNAAVSRLLSGRRALQRKIGFELEAGEWSAALLDRPLAMMEQQSGVVSHNARTKPPDARTAFYAKDNIQGTADELPGTRRDVEFVIKERDEGQSDAIADDFDKVGAAFEQMHAQLPGGAWMWPEKRLGWRPPHAGVWLLDNASGDRTVQMQATAGIPLAQIASLMEGLDPDASDPVDALDDPREQTGMHPGAGGSVGYSHAAASAAVEAFSDKRTSVAGLDPSPAGLVGLMALMAQMIVGGDVDPGKENDAPYAYPKAMAHLLPRTDFVHMFGLLPEPLQATLKAPDVIDSNRPALVSLVAELCEQAGLGGVDKPVLGWSNWKQIEPGMIVPDLTRELWARGIVAGQDRLSQSGYLAWLESRKDTLKAGEYEKRKKQSAQLDSLGAWKDKMDTRGNEKLPLVEFRAIVLEDLTRDMTIAEAKRVGTRLAEYINRLVG